MSVSSTVATILPCLARRSRLARTSIPRTAVNGANTSESVLGSLSTTGRASGNLFRLCSLRGRRSSSESEPATGGGSFLVCYSARSSMTSRTSTIALVNPLKPNSTIFAERTSADFAPTVPKSLPILLSRYRNRCRFLSCRDQLFYRSVCEWTSGLSEDSGLLCRTRSDVWTNCFVDYFADFRFLDRRTLVFFCRLETNTSRADFSQTKLSCRLLNERTSGPSVKKLCRVVSGPIFARVPLQRRVKKPVRASRTYTFSGSNRSIRRSNCRSWRQSRAASRSTAKKKIKITFPKKLRMRTSCIDKRSIR